MIWVWALSSQTHYADNMGSLYMLGLWETHYADNIGSFFFYLYYNVIQNIIHYSFAIYCSLFFGSSGERQNQNFVLLRTKFLLLYYSKYHTLQLPYILQSLFRVIRRTAEPKFGFAQNQIFIIMLFKISYTIASLYIVVSFQGGAENGETKIWFCTEPNFYDNDIQNIIHYSRFCVRLQLRYILQYLFRVVRRTAEPNFLL